MKTKKSCAPELLTVAGGDVPAALGFGDGFGKDGLVVIGVALLGVVGVTAGTLAATGCETD